LEKSSLQGSGKTQVFQKSPAHCVLGVSLGVGLYWFFGFFYLNGPLGSLLFNLARQPIFYLDSAVLRLSKNLQIHYLLVVRSCEHKEIFNYYWYDKLKLN